MPQLIIQDTQQVVFEGTEQQCKEFLEKYVDETEKPPLIFVP